MWPLPPSRIQETCSGPIRPNSLNSCKSGCGYDFGTSRSKVKAIENGRQLCDHLQCLACPTEYSLLCRLPVIWATNQLGDRKVGDKPTGQQPTWRNILVNETEVETTGPWKCERLTIAVLEQLCAVLGQRPFNITHQTNLPHSSLECYKCGFNWRIAVFSEPNCAGGFSAHIRLFTHN